MNNINESSIKVVRDLFDETILKNDGTGLGNIKAVLQEQKGSEFIKKYDLLIDELIHKKLYSIYHDYRA